MIRWMQCIGSPFENADAALATAELNACYGRLVVAEHIPGRGWSVWSADMPEHPERYLSPVGTVAGNGRVAWKAPTKQRRRSKSEGPSDV